MMRHSVLLVILLALAACAPALSPEPLPLSLPENCQAERPVAELLASDWLLQPATWRLRQSALLEIGGRKIVMEGLLRLDLQRRQARLLAMNEVGLVLFDLEVSETGETLHRMVPPLLEIDGFTRGIALSLRQVFLAPRPQLTDRPESHGNSQRLWRPVGDGRVDFVFDCRGDRRATLLQNQADNWQVLYGDYQRFVDVDLPGKIIMNDYQHRVRLSLWTREVRQEP